MTYETFGPFDMSRDGNMPSKGAVLNLWSKAEAARKGLPDATGIYILAMKDPGQSVPFPWYVGRTCEQGFKGRFPQKMRHFMEVLGKSSTGELIIFFIARLNNSGKGFRKRTETKGGIGSNDWLEQRLIEECFRANPALINVANTRYLKKVKVPGYMDGPVRSANDPAVSLRILLSQRKD